MEKTLSSLSNSEIINYKSSVEERFEKIKSQISELCNQLEELEEEYNNIETELKLRQNG